MNPHIKQILIGIAIGLAFLVIRAIASYIFYMLIFGAGTQSDDTITLAFLILDGLSIVFVSSLFKKIGKVSSIIGVILPVFVFITELIDFLN